jgi:hypothetical protein
MALSIAQQERLTKDSQEFHALDTVQDGEERKLIAWLSWAAGGSMKAISAILVATVAVLSQLAQLFNFARTGLPPPAKDAG